MAKTSEKPLLKFSLRLLIDEEKNRVVLAEAGKDFVDVLCGLLTLPMGTIVRLLEKHLKPQSSIVGCFHNLYKSVAVMNDDNFVTQASKNLLLYPKSMKEAHGKRLKLNLVDAEETTFFVCSIYMYEDSCCKTYSNFRNSKCRCGRTMVNTIHFEGEQTDSCSGNEADGVFLSCRTSFIITDDLKVERNSMSLVLNILNDLGYAGFDKLREMYLDVGFDEVMNLLGCLFTSEAPLTDIFLRKHCMSRKRRMLTPLAQASRVAEEKDRPLTLKVFVRKLDKKILYAECNEEFVDFLFTFLVIPLEFAWDLSVDNDNLGCVGNLCRSLKKMTSEKQKTATTSKCIFPHYYNCRSQLLDVVIQETPEYECLVSRHGYSHNTISRKIKKKVLSTDEKIVKIISVDSKAASIGLVKRETNFIVSDDLIVTPMNSSSTISLLSKLQMSTSDIEEEVISFGKAEATSLLRASLITNSGLTDGLSNFLSKMDPIEATQSTVSPKKTRKTTRPRIKNRRSNRKTQ